MKNMIRGTTSHKPWTITKNGMIPQSFLKIQVTTMSLRKNILNWNFILANVKPNIGYLKPIISPFITGYYLLHYMFNKLICLMLFCTFEASTITRKTIIYIYKTIFETITSSPNVISDWINKPCLYYTRKRRKTSHGSRKFS